MYTILVSLLIGIGVSIYYYTRDPAHMKDYEKQFIEHYGPNPTELVRLTLDHTDRELLLEVCGRKVNKNKLNANPPAKKIEYIDFKKEVHHPFSAEVIRCNDTYAMIGGFEPHCIFVLKKGKSIKQNDGTIRVYFYFYETFCYRPKDEKSPAESSESQEERHPPTTGTKDRSIARLTSQEERSMSESEHKASVHVPTIQENSDLPSDQSDKKDYSEILEARPESGKDAEDKSTSSEKSSSSEEHPKPKQIEKVID